VETPTLNAFHCLHCTKNFSPSLVNTRSTPPSAPPPPVSRARRSRAA
jgi:hypothetical protein